MNNSFSKDTISAILDGLKKGEIHKELAKNLINQMSHSNTISNTNKDIAIIGMSVKLPDADDHHVFWENLIDGKNSISELSQQRKEDASKIQLSHGSQIRDFINGGFLDRIDFFDNRFFGLSPKEAKFMDPHHRIFLENSWKALEDAGYSSELIKGSKTGVFVGFSNWPTYGQYISENFQDDFSNAFVGNIPSIIAGRLSHLLDLKGPAMLIDSACSSSLVAVHQACKSISGNDCEMAIVGSVNLNLSPFKKNSIGIDSISNQVHAFDDFADGTVWSEACVTLILKDLKKARESNDNIYAVIKGSAINQDGTSVGITAPNTIAQVEVISKAIEEAGVSVEDIGYIETHGTGTKMGDPIEFDALNKVFGARTEKKQYCAIGSVKSNIGHADNSSGMVGLVKTILSLKKQQIPKTINFELPNSNISFENSAFYINTKHSLWESGMKKRIAGVSSFGLSGTNCHLVIEEYPVIERSDSYNNEEIFILSGLDHQALMRYVEKYLSYLNNNKIEGELRDICYSSAVGRKTLNSRIAIIANNINDLKMKLTAIHSNNFTSFENEIFVNSEGTSSIEKKDVFDIGNSSLAKICHYFIQGGSINWQDYYAGTDNKKISLPTYPFESKRFWLEENERMSAKKTLSDFKNVIQTPKGYIQIFELNVDRNWEIQDHQIYDQFTLPGAGFVDFIAQGIEKISEEKSFSFEKMVFTKPLTMRKKELRTLLINFEKISFNEFLCDVYSKKADQQWVKHCEAVITMKKLYPEEQLLDNLSEYERVEIEEYLPESNHFASFGPHWKTAKIDNIFKHDKEIILTIELAKKFQNECNHRYIHPTLLDLATTLGSAVFKKPYLPLSYENMDVYGKIPHKIKVKISVLQSDTDNLTFGVAIYDTANKIKVKIKRFTMRKISNQLFAQNTDNQAISQYRFGWEKSSFPKDSLLPKEILIIENEFLKVNNLKKNLKKLEISYKVLTIKENETISDFTKKLKAFLENDSVYETIYWTVSSEKKDVETDFDFLEQEESALSYYFYFLKELLAIVKQNTEVVIFTNQLEKISHGNKNFIPVESSILGLSKVVEAEYNNLQVKQVDINYEDSVNDEEIFAISGTKNKDISIRDNKLYIKKMYLENTSSLENDQLFSKQSKATYIITGGLGSLGLKFASHISKKTIATIVLISRKIFITRDNDGYFVNKSSKVSSDIANLLNKIEETGCTVVLVSQDITKFDSTKEQLSNLREKYGVITGVIHAAGVSGATVFEQLSYDEFLSVIRPKTLGTWNIYQSTLKDNLDFFVLCSSVNTLNGETGRSSYTAGNTFLDYFSSQKGILTINWPAWENSQMVKEIVRDGNEGFERLSDKQGLELFDQLIDKKEQQIIVGDLNKDSNFLGDTNQFHFLLDTMITEKLGDESVTKNVKQMNYQIDSDYMKNNISQLLLDVFCEELELENVNEKDNFYEVGGDSILAIKITNIINERFNFELDFSIILSNPIVGDFIKEVAKEVIPTNELQKKSENFENERLDSEEYSLSKMQIGIWVQEKFHGNRKHFHLPMLYKLPLNIKKDLFGKVFELLIERHEMLRTVFIEKKDYLYQKVLKKYEINLKTVTVSTFEKAKEFVLEDNKNLLLSENIPPFRAYLIHVEEGADYFYLNIHHLICDGWSSEVILKEMKEIYFSLDAGIEPELPEITLTNMKWQEEQDMWLTSKAGTEARRFWENELVEPLPTLPMDSYQEDQSEKKTKAEIIEFEFEPDIANRIKKFRSSRNVSDSSYFMSILFLTLNKLSSNEDLIIGTNFSNRINKNIENNVGMYNNTMVMRTKVNPDASFESFLKKIKEKNIQLFPFAKFPFSEIVKLINPKRMHTSNPIFQIYYQFYENNPPINYSEPLFDFALFGEYEKDFYKFRIEYDSQLFSEEYITHFKNLFIEIISETLIDSNKKLGSINHLTTKDVEIINQANSTCKDWQDDRTLIQMFEQQVRNNPTKKAVFFENESMTYRELDESVNKIANFLKENKVTKNDVIAIMMDRSFEMIMSILAILKSGAAYLPISTSLPLDRKEIILKDSKAKFILCRDILVADFSIPVFNIAMIDFSKYSIQAPENTIDSDSLAYLIYTSGSTGIPKGVRIEHKALKNRLLWMQSHYSLDKKDVVIQKTDYSFDVSVWELLWWGISGASLVLMKQGDERFPEKICSCIESNKVTVIHFVPAMLTAFLEYLNSNSISMEKLKSLKQVYCSGEALLAETVNRFWDYFGEGQQIRITNLYGPTEATIDVTYYDCPSCNENTEIPIGLPISNTEIYLLDEQLNQVPIGIPGEIYIGGQGLAKEYTDKNQTATAFVQLAKFKHQRFYKTGDIAKRRKDGQILYLGRKDNQVKINGYRIELDEITNSLLKNRGISEAVTLVNSSSQLVSFIVLNSKMDQLDKQLIRDNLSEYLPKYMLPNLIHAVEKIPLTINGKIDRKKLLTDYQAVEKPLTNKNKMDKTVLQTLENRIVQIWKEVLNLEFVNGNDSFFKLGGDSIKVITLVNKMNRELGLKLETFEVYKAQTINNLLEQISGDFERPVETIVEIDRFSEIRRNAIFKIREDEIKLPQFDDIFPLSNIQNSMLFYSELDLDKPIYHDQFLYQIKFTDFDLNIFIKALERLIQKHPMLRTMFCLKDFSQPMQVVLSRINTEDYFNYLDMSQDSIVKEKSLQEQLLLDSQDRFLLDKGKLWRLKLIYLGNDEYCMVVSSFHAILDGWSAALFDSDLLSFYDRLKNENECFETPLLNSYKEYVKININKQKNSSSIGFWQDKLKGFKRNKLPFNLSGKKLGTYSEIGMIKQIFDDAWFSKFQLYAQSIDVSVKSLFLYCHVLLMKIITDETSIITGAVTHDRPAIDDSEKIIGCFLNTIPVALKFNENQSVEAGIYSVNQYLNESKEHEMFLGDIADALNEKRDHTNPLFDTLFNFVDFHIRDKSSAYKDIEKKEEQFDLINNDMTNTLFDVEIAKTYEQCTVSIKFSKEYFLEKDIQVAFELFVTILNELISNSKVGQKEFTTSILSHVTPSTLIGDSVDYSLDKKIPFLVEEVELGVAVAIQDDTNSLTYEQLNKQVKQYAAYLISNNVQARDNVLIYVERSVEWVISILALWRIGAIYIPIDINYPHERIKTIIEDSKTKFLITDKHHTFETLYPEVSTILIEDLKQSSETLIENSSNQSNSLAYVIYTSGSTGKPKGVMVEHSGMMNHIYNKIDDLQITRESVIAQNASASFDISIWQTFAALITGGKVIIYGNDYNLNPPLLLESIAKDKITHFECVPSLLTELIETYKASDKNDLPYLKYCISTGELLKSSIVNKWFGLFPEKFLVNAYGPTEASDDITHHIMKTGISNVSVPVGKPLNNVSLYIVNSCLEILPRGSVGEIIVGGVCVGAGYLNNEEKTKASFFVHDFGEGQKKCYKTGDLGRILPDGAVEFLGRKDSQVKINGYRVELTEIENQIQLIDRVIDVAVDIRSVENQQEICAFLIVKEKFEIKDVREHLSKYLPLYMIPSKFTTVDRFEYTVNGKVNKSKLKIGQQEESVSTSVKYLDKIEQKILLIFEDSLKKESLNRDSNFFEQGGNSLKAAAVTRRLVDEMQINLSLKDFFSSNSISDLAHKIRKQQEMVFPKIEKAQSQFESYPVNSAQKRMYFSQMREPELTLYNIPIALKIIGKLDKEKTKNTFAELVKRHEVLRTSYSYQKGTIRGTVNQSSDYDFQVISHFNNLNEISLLDYIVPFRLSEKCMLRVRLFEISESETILFVDTHHIAVDGISMSILLNEFCLLYRGVPLKQNTIDFSDVLLWLEKLNNSQILLEQKSYWLKLFKHENIDNEMRNRDVKTIDHFNGDTFVFTIDRNLYQRLTELKKKWATTTFSILQMLVYILRYLETGDSDIFIGTTVSGRGSAIEEELVGMFVNILPIHIHLDEKLSLKEILNKLKIANSNAYDNQFYPYEELVDELEGQGINLTGILDTMVVSTNGVMSENQYIDEKIILERIEIRRKLSKFSREFQFHELEDSVEVTLDFNTHRYSKVDMENTRDRLFEILNYLMNNVDTTLNQLLREVKGNKQVEQIEFQFDE